MPVTKGPESAASSRRIDLDGATVAVLRAWKVTQLEERLRPGEAWVLGEWVFTNQIGEPWRPDTLTRALVGPNQGIGTGCN